MVTTVDPIQGLVDYVLEIKPYHTKIVEVLVEYIHTDPVNVTITEQFDACVNFGFPELNSRYIFPIIAVDTIDNTFTIEGNRTFELFVGQTFQLFDSTLNDGTYTVTNLVFDGTNTTISVQSQILNTSVSGSIVHYVIEYCPGLNLYGSATPPEEIEGFCVGGYGDVYDSFSETFEPYCRCNNWRSKTSFGLRPLRKHFCNVGRG